MDHTDTEVDVVVVGVGAAGAAAAIEARANGASVCALDRFDGGGASAMSGGQLYFGGGTTYQREAGYEDTPEEMFRYLKMQVGDVVSDDTLHQFCDESVGNIDWLIEQGIEFRGTLNPWKSSYPGPQYFLHFSGNEASSPYREGAAVAPRSHRPVGGPGMTGQVLMDRLIASAERQGVEIRRNAHVRQLIVEHGAVVGVEYTPTDAGSDAPTVRVRARSGVILSAGGFGFNTDMMRQNAPQYPAQYPLGTEGDDGTGMHMGQQAGGALDHMDSIAAWIFIYPPHSAVRGVLVGPSGRRVCNEGLYGASVAKEVVERHGGRCWLVLDQAVVDRARDELPEQANPEMRERLDALWADSGHVVAGSVTELAGLLGIEPSSLAQTLAVYNRAAERGDRDAFAKLPEFVQPLQQAPFHAIDFSLLGGAMSLGGLVVDEQSGLVERPDGSSIDGLYAAGRNAVGICSTAYVSGLSLADCIFSGRRAGRHAAAVAESAR